jgi:hypothetical protein
MNLPYDSDYTTIAYDASTGARRWLSRYDGGGTYGDGATGIGVTTTAPASS